MYLLKTENFSIPINSILIDELIYELFRKHLFLDILNAMDLNSK